MINISDVENLEERLKRIERKLFPENIRILYDYYGKCNNPTCIKNIKNTIWVKANLSNPVVMFCEECGNELEIKNIIKHEEIIFY